MECPRKMAYPPAQRQSRTLKKDALGIGWALGTIFSKCMGEQNRNL
jgi:hypothetical protein